MRILVTGGLGYIGSHVSVMLMEQDYQVVIVDNLENTSETVLEGMQQITGKTPVFEKMDLRVHGTHQALFKKYPDIAGVIHFAAHKAVGESIENPLKYYENNLHSLIYLLQQCVEKCIPFIFSSSATVYGEADKIPIAEDSPVKPPLSPYGNTKKIGEEIIRDICRTCSEFNAVLLRYFNPIGAHPSALIGELPLGIPQNLVPFLTQTVAGWRKILNVFGNDYDTPDGTCIRDYIHIMDLAAAHIRSLEFLIQEENQSNCEIFNIGTGNGNSVLEVIQTFEQVNEIPVPHQFAPRRSGDVMAMYADTSKAMHVLKWKAKYNLDTALESAWKWQSRIENQNA